MDSIAYLARDALLLALLLLAIFFVPSPPRLANRLPIKLMAIAFGVGYFATGQVFASSVSWETALLGAHLMLTPALFAYVAVRAFGDAGPRSLGNVVLFWLPVQAVITITQVLSPRASFVNRVSRDEFQTLGTSGDVVRASGTFTAPFALVLFAVLASAFWLARGSETESQPQYRLVGIQGASIAIIAILGGSRATIFLVGCMLIAAILVSFPGIHAIPRGRSGARILAIITLAGIAALAFPSVTHAFVGRFQDASLHDSLTNRIVGTTFGYLVHLGSDLKLFGDGMGTHSAASVQLYGGFWIEDELSRWVVELGIVGLLLVVSRQIWAIYMLISEFRRARRIGGNSLGFLLAAALAPSLLAGQTVSQPSVTGYAAIGIGSLCLAIGSANAAEER